MKLIAVLAAFSCVLVVSAGNSAAIDPAEKQRKVTSSGGYAAVLDKLHRDGAVRLIVTLNTPFQPMGHLQKHEAQLQRDTIAAMQSEIHASLQGLNVINVTNFVHVPQIALTAHLDAFERSWHIEARRGTAETSAAGIPALNFGPGATAQAHQQGEWVELAAVESAYRALERFLRP